MTRKCRRIGARNIYLLWGILWFLCPGCSEPEPGFELVTLEGTIEEITRNTDESGQITVLYYSEKQGQEIIGTGLVTRETQIMVNGAIARLRDLREGDRIRGEVRVEKKGDDKIQTALKIYVDRPTPVGSD